MRENILNKLQWNTHVTHTHNFAIYLCNHNKKHFNGHYYLVLIII